MVCISRFGQDFSDFQILQSDFPPLAAIDVYCQSNLDSATAGLFHLLTKGLRIVARLGTKALRQLSVSGSVDMVSFIDREKKSTFFGRISLMHNNIFIILNIFTQNFRRLSVLQLQGL